MPERDRELYSIGKTAKLFNLSVQTLRHYDKIGLLRPMVVNPKTGYRYYTFDQFHYIDRIKYLQNMGLSLGEIKEILDSGNVDNLVKSLQKKRQSLERDIREIENTIDDIQWYIEYFGYMGKSKRGHEGIYISYYEERHVLTAACTPQDPFPEVETRLTQLKNSEPFKQVGYRRQYGFIVDCPDLLREVFSPTASTIYFKHKPDFESEYVTRLPAGPYLCFTAKIRLDAWDSAPVNAFLKKTGASPGIAVANEFEDNLTEFVATPYEVQIQLLNYSPQKNNQ